MYNNIHNMSRPTFPWRWHLIDEPWVLWKASTFTSFSLLFFFFFFSNWTGLAGPWLCGLLVQFNWFNWFDSTDSTGYKLIVISVDNVDNVGNVGILRSRHIFYCTFLLFSHFNIKLLLPAFLYLAVLFIVIYSYIATGKPISPIPCGVNLTNQV